MIFFLFFPGNLDIDISCRLPGDDLHQMLKPIFWGKKKKIKMLSAEILPGMQSFKTQRDCDVDMIFLRVSFFCFFCIK